MPPKALTEIASSMHLWVNRDAGKQGACTHYAMKDFEPCGGCAPRPLAVELFCWRHYLSWNLAREGTLFHEFSHVYHGLLGHAHEKICGMYAAGMESGKYESVPHCGGRHLRAYA